MAVFKHLTPAHARRVPWKNGRGVTDEIALGPAGSSFEQGDFDWRVASAPVVEAGPFSTFPGFERVLVVTQGAGLRLRHGPDGAWVTLAPLTPYAFSGDVPTDAELVDGPVRDLNALVRRAYGRALVHVLQPGPAGAEALLGPGPALVHVVGGPLRATVPPAPGATLLRPGDSLCVLDTAGTCGLTLAGDGTGAALVIALEPRALRRAT